MKHSFPRYCQVVSAQLKYPKSKFKNVRLNSQWKPAYGGVTFVTVVDASLLPDALVLPLLSLGLSLHHQLNHIVQTC